MAKIFSRAEQYTQKIRYAADRHCTMKTHTSDNPALLIHPHEFDSAETGFYQSILMGFPMISSSTSGIVL